MDRLVAPWIETAQRSASLRLFSQYSTAGASQREGAAVSWVFPRPWYQDELNWMAAARQVQTDTSDGASPSLFTTRGTFVAPQAPQAQRPAIAAPQTAMPSALYEYVAPSLSIAQPTPQSAISGIGYGGSAEPGRVLDAYSSLIPLAAVQAAELMSRAVAPLMGATGPTAGGRAPISDGAGAPSTMGRVSPALRNVLTTMLERATMQRADARVALQAPELVTPPAPRATDVAAPSSMTAQVSTPFSETSSPASRLADHYAGQRAQIADLQRIARVSAERELALRTEAAVSEQQITARVDAQTTAKRAEEVRATTQRTAAEAQQRTVTAVEAQRTAQAAAQATVEAVREAERVREAARLEERIAQRVAERTGQEVARSGQQRLHEQARAEAAQHARASVEQLAVAEAAAAPAPVSEVGRAPAAVTAAIAALPPELQQMIASRPERGMAAIAELVEVLRTAELMARSTHANQAFEVTRGPRLMMPAGLGGLVSAVERAHVISERPAQLAAPMLSSAQTSSAVPQLATMRAPQPVVHRVPSLPWLTGPAPTQRASAAPSTALGATAAASPAALNHVAWSDRWLARFAGATPRSLEILQASAGASPELRMQALASAAPESVFLRAMFDADSAPRQAMPIEAAPSFGGTSFVAGTATPMPVLRPSPPPVERFDDNAETPDAVFAQIAAAAAGVRTSAASSSVGTAATATTATTALAAPIAIDYARMTPADAVAHSAATAPNAGLSAGLAASPFAPALRHLLPLPAAASFDVRALFGGGLSATYLAGLIAPSSTELEVAGIGAPAWASFSPAATTAAERMDRSAPELDLTYVAPELLSAATAASAISGGLSTAEDSGVVAQPAAATAVDAPLPASYVAPLTTLRTALLSWSVDPSSASGSAAMFAEQPTVSATQTTPVTSSAARAMSESMSLPMLAEVMPALEAGSAWTSPGMVADRAHGWAVAQERSSSDLSLDFVTPELVLAARVYGLGPAEAAQAARLAIAGPGQLSAMASAVDRTFVQAMAISTDRREAARAAAAPFSAPNLAATGAGPGSIATAYPVTPVASVGPTAGLTAGVLESDAYAASARPDHTLPSTAFGVERRAPRGAFLWPSATVAALGLNAAAPDGQQSMSVAALELLAAQAVAEIGTFAAFSDRPFISAAGEDASAFATDAGRESRMLPPVGAEGVGRAAGSAQAAAFGSPALPSLAEPGEADVLGAATALVSTSRRARFDALYVALSQSPSGRNWSPAARAARALALAGRGDDTSTSVSAYERAATAWDVLPVVYATDNMSIAEIDAATATGTLPGVASFASTGRRRPGAPDMPTIDGRPGLSSLSSRAGEALGSYVAPSTGELASAVMRSESGSSSSSSSSRDREMPVAQRAPTAAQELVRTGRPSGRHGGGEVEIPTWFESAARKMLDDRSSSASSDGGFSLAELTLVTSAPASQVAASTKAPHSASVAPAVVSGGEKAQAGAPVDIEKIANEVYRQILVLMDTARSRNGEPYL
ncbi:MAG: hypothetical protein IPQ07_34830 [Myxococcales bacterium]|nr:hypothetical protein [Myxococcales bacterium]